MKVTKCLGTAGLMFILAMGSWAQGLQVTIEDVNINDELKPEVTFTLKNDAGDPLTLEDVSIRGFMIAKLDVLDADKGSMVYHSYTTSVQTVPEGEENAGASAEQATYDSGGEYTEVETGKYFYTFDTALPNDYDATATHTVGGQLELVVEDEDDAPLYAANPLYHFVPDGNEVEFLRKVVTTEGCNKCHTGMGIHGGARRAVGLCILCHSPQTTDPDTGNSVDMTEMTHKIHMGANLPSVQEGGEYKIIGYRQSEHDYSHVEFPTDNRNCTICHDGVQADVYKTAPSRRACGSCHDNIDFEEGIGHIAQADDNSCAQCHPPEEGGVIAVEAAHTIPTQSEEMPGLEAEILEISNMEAGVPPVVRFYVANGDGSEVDFSGLRTLRITYAGTTDDYTHYLSEDATGAEPQGDNEYIYTFEEPLPVDAGGTYGFSMEVRRNVTLDDTEVTEAARNPVEIAAVGESELMPRREIVDEAKCNACHGELSFHGSLRNNVDYCVMCHNPKMSDIGRRPEEVMGGESVSMGYMIHKIHRGHDLNQDYTVYGYGERAHNYNDVLFPGKNQECSICHVEDVPSLPLAETVEPIEFENKEGEIVFMGATMAACTSCHDSQDAIDHANNFVSDDGSEICAQCHAAGTSSDITQIHQDQEFLNSEEVIAPPSTWVRTWLEHNN